MTEERKEWLVGAPEFKDRSFTLSEVRELIRDGRIHVSDLVLRIGDVWKSAQDYTELAPEFSAQPAVTPPSPPAVVAREPSPPAAPRRATEPRISVKMPSPPPPPTPPAPMPPQPPKAPKIVIRPQPATGELPPSPSAATERMIRPDAAGGMPPQPPTAGQEAAGSDGAAPSPSAQETDVQPSVSPEAVSLRRGGKKAIPETSPPLETLELDTFTTKDVFDRLRYIFHPLKLLVCSLLIVIALATGGLIDLGRSSLTLVFAGWIYFAFFGVFHALAALMTRFEIEGARGVHLLVLFLKRGLTLSITAGMALLLLGSLAFFAVMAYDLDKMVATIVLSLTGIAFVLMSLVFTITGGYLNAILAVEVCGVRAAFSRLIELYRVGFRRMLGHSAVMVIFSHALFVMVFLPVLAHGVLWMSEAKFQPPKPFIFLLFGLASAFAVAALATLNVYSYLWITRNMKAAREGKGNETERTPQVAASGGGTGGLDASPPEEAGADPSTETQAAEPVDPTGGEPSEGRPAE